MGIMVISLFSFSRISFRSLFRFLHLFRSASPVSRFFDFPDVHFPASRDFQIYSRHFPCPPHITWGSEAAVIIGEIRTLFLFFRAVSHGGITYAPPKTISPNLRPLFSDFPFSPTGKSPRPMSGFRRVKLGALSA